MNIEKEQGKIAQGITSSSEKRKVLITRLEEFEKRLKKHWYTKLLNKLESVKNGDVNIDDYINEVKNKIN